MAPSSKNGECVRVMVRIRPLSNKEKQDGRIIIATANPDRAEVCIQNPNGDSSEPPKTFTFDATFPAETTQQQVYDTAATELIEAVMTGYNATIFAYGQTGAGKSHTMEGYPDPPELQGIIPNSFKHIFDKVAITKNKQFLVRASYLEIYNEEVRDLLAKDPKNRLELKENIDTGVYVKDLTSIAVKDAAEIDHVMQAGKKNRSVGSTMMNQTSSRSHSIFTIVVECCDKGLDGNDHICMGKLNLVDLAGSERQSKTGATGDRLKEATKINLSLSALGNVISALVESKSQHIPYRDSKLTRLLQDSLGGNTKTVMIANCGPAEYNFDETVTTLRYASRAKNIKNKPKINEDPKDAMLRQYQEEINELKAQLEQCGSVTMIVDGKEVQVPAGAAPKEVIEVEKIVEKIVIEKGISKEEARRIEEKSRKEKEELKRKSKEELERAAKGMAEATESKKEMEERLEAEHKHEEELRLQKEALSQKLSQMETKLLVGGEMMDKAAKQEDELRKAKLALQEKKRQELQLARELAEREEANLMMEEQYNSLQEEAEAKTKKLKKVWTKVKEVQAEIKQIQHVFNREREDLLDTIRQLSADYKMECLVIKYYVPEDALAQLERNARWNEEENAWTMDHLEFSGNALRPSRQRPSSASVLRRPETSRRGLQHQKDTDVDANVLELRNPYLAYSSDRTGDGYVHATELKSASKSKSSKSKARKRPGTAARHVR